MKFEFQKALVIFFSLLSVCVLIFFNAINVKIEYSILVVVFQSSLSFVFALARRHLFVVCFFIFSASLPIYESVALQLPISAFENTQNIEYKRDVVFLFSIFLFGFHSFIKLARSNFKEYFHIKLESPYFYFFCFALCISSLVFGISGNSILTTGQYDLQGLDKSPLHEYFVLFYSLLLVNNYKFKSKNFVEISLLIYFCFKSLLFGGRIEVVQAFFVYMMLRYSFLVNFKWYYLFASVVSAYFIMALIGVVRESPQFVISALNGNIDLSLLTFRNADEKAWVGGTFGDVWYSSVRLVFLVDNNFLDFSLRMQSFFSFIFNAFAPSSFWPPYANLSAFLQSSFPSPGGSFSFVQFYVWLGYFGPYFNGIFLACVCNSVFSRNPFFSFYSFLALVTFPRWFLYNPVALTKFCLIGAALILLVTYFEKKINKRF